VNLWQLIRQPNSDIAKTLADISFVKQMKFTEDVLQAVIIDAKYEGYLDKQTRLLASFRALENKKIPLNLDYNGITHLRAEAKEKLSAFRPGTLGQAGRIGGITPADITIIQIHLKKMSK